MRPKFLFQTKLNSCTFTKGILIFPNYLIGIPKHQVISLERFRQFECDSFVTSKTRLYVVIALCVALNVVKSFNMIEFSTILIKKRRPKIKAAMNVDTCFSIILKLDSRYYKFSAFFRTDFSFSSFLKRH